MATGANDSGSDGTIILNKYKLIRLLGRGSFAKVYRGRFVLETKAAAAGDVAIKIIDKSNAAVAKTEAFILREISAMRRLNHHPNILKLHEVMATKTKIYLVMELAHGGDLSGKLCRRGGRFSNSTARFYFRQLVSAVRFCHQNGVAHRDIKPQNLLLDRVGHLKISDFGLSALPEQLKDGLLHTACGTPAYTAPEVLAGKQYDGAKADAWSCGVLLFEFLAGHLPFDDGNLPSMFRSMTRREFQFPDWISKRARSIIHRLLDPNPVTRSSLEEFENHPWLSQEFSQRAPERVAVADSQQLDVTDERKYGHGAIIDHHKECAHNISMMNAFDIILMSSGLDLSWLFEAGELSKKEMRFTTKAQLGEIEERVEKMGYCVERLKEGGGIRVVKGRVVLMVEILLVSKEILLVEIKVVNGGMGFEEDKWEEFKVGLKDIVVSWYNDRN